MAERRRLIINIENEATDIQALERVKQVVSEGLISGNDSQYCFHTTFTDGSHVSCLKRPSGTMTFYVGGS